MRPSHHAPLPDRDVLLSALNGLLERHHLPRCDALDGAGIDADTYNPVVAARAGARRYAVKVKARFTPFLRSDLDAVNAVIRATDLPIPAHLCCTEPHDPLPLLVMEWAAGSSFKAQIPALPPGQVRDVFTEWGACMGRYHRAHAAVPGLELQQPAATQQWWRDMAYGSLRGAHWDDAQRAQITHYLEPRFATLATLAAPGLVKADDEPHDVLVDGEPRRISALIDWERIQLGDTACAVGCVYLRLRMMGLISLWPYFLAGYGRDGSLPPQCPQVEAVLMSRALRAAENQRAGVELVGELLAGRRLPFGGGSVADSSTPTWRRNKFRNRRPVPETAACGKFWERERRASPTFHASAETRSSAISADR